MKAYPLVTKAGFSIIELSPDFSRRAVWCDELEKYLEENQLREITVSGFLGPNKMPKYPRNHPGLDKCLIGLAGIKGLIGKLIIVQLTMLTKRLRKLLL